MVLRFLGFLFTAGFVVFLVVAAVAGYMLWKVSDDLPDYASLREYKPAVMTRIHAADGELVAEYAVERRLFMPIQGVPKTVIEAFLSAEDKNFYSHFGIDLIGVGRAMAENIQSFIRGGGKGLVGGSSITQQVAKNFLLTNEKSYIRKMKEALLALRIESAFTKDQILELYLNEIYFGVSAYGIAAAALIYFDKSVDALTIAEAAYLAALPKAPNNYHPFRQSERAIERRNWVIGRMEVNGFITAAEAEEAINTPLDVTLRATGARLQAAEYFVEEVRRRLYELYGEDGLYKGGLSVRSTLDPKLQVLARNALISSLTRYDRGRGWRGPVAEVEIGGDWGEAVSGVESLGDVEPWQLAIALKVENDGAVIGLRPNKFLSGQFSKQRDVGRIPLANLKWAKWADGPSRGRSISKATQVLKTGDVFYVSPATDSDGDIEDGVFDLQQVPEVSGGMVVMDPHTGRVLALVGGFSYAESEFNRATQAMRQPGSAFKPFIYAAALDNGYSPSSVVVDAPLEIVSGGKIWRPQNYGGKFAGPSTLRRGIEKSRNVMTVRLAQDMGMPVIREYAKRFGIYDDLLPYLPMALGAGETTVMRLVSAYATIANGGRKITPTLIDRVQDRYGATIYKHDARVCENCSQRRWNGQDEPELIDNRDQVLDPFTDYQIISMMEGVVQRGTARTLQKVGRPVAGKTGTTNDEKDAWFVGFTPDLVAGAYIGYDQPKPLGHGMTGGSLAAPVVRDFFIEALAGKPPIPFRVPPGIQLVRINATTGLRAGASESNVILEAFKPGQEPPDRYSAIGYQKDKNRPLTVSPEADQAVGSATGGLY